MKMYSKEHDKEVRATLDVTSGVDSSSKDSEMGDGSKPVSGQVTGQPRAMLDSGYSTGPELVTPMSPSGGSVFPWRGGQWNIC